jgi:hypothetical protein
MTRITLHIGTHKTGTTFLQRQLESQRDALADQGVHYLRQGPNHSWLYLAFCDAPETEHAAMRLGLVGADAARAWADQRRVSLRRELAECRLPRVLISGEELCRMSLPTATRMLALLREFSDTVDVVCCVRDCTSYANSDAQESIKGGLTWQQALIQIPQAHFRSALEIYTSLLGKPSISVFAFERGQNKQHLTNFAAACRLKLELADVSADANLALSAEAAYVLGEINRLYPPFVDQKANPARANIPAGWLAALGKRPFTLPADTLKAARIAQKNDYQWLSSFAGIDLPLGDTALPVQADEYSPDRHMTLTDCAVILHTAAKTIDDTMSGYMLMSAELDYLKGKNARAQATLERLQQFKASDPDYQRRIERIREAGASKVIKSDHAEVPAVST